MPTILEQYRISDFLEWHREGKLELNPDFQRGSVWTPVARSYLVDTILRQLPVPKIYLRTKIDIVTKRSIREVVDGQQRLRAIIDFGNDEFSLGKRAAEFAGYKYSTLPADLQEIFLSYALSVDQLLNANNEDVLEVFARLNSYNVQLNPPEKRHAAFQGEFKWAIREASREWKILWESYGVVSVRQRVRMEDDSLMAEMFAVIMEGVRDGGQDNITRFYRQHDDTFDPKSGVRERVGTVIEFILVNFADFLRGSPVLRGPHFLMLFSAVAHALVGIPEGELNENFPARDNRALSDVAVAKNNMLQLAAVIGSDNPVPGYEEFWKASKYTTQRIASRRVRFPMFYKGLLPEPL